MPTTLDNGTTLPVSLGHVKPTTDPAPWGGTGDGWRVTLRHDETGDTLTVPFWMGKGHHGRPPTAADVLDCLTADAALLEEAGHADGDPLAIMAGLYALDVLPHDGDDAARVTRAMIDNARDLARFLCDDYDRAIWPEG